MVRFFKILRSSLLTLTTISLVLLVYGFYTVPDEIYKLSNEEINVREIYSISMSELETDGQGIESLNEEGSYNVNVSLFNTIPIKQTKMTVSKRKYVVVSGDIFGLRIYTDGILVVGTSSVETASGTRNPAAEAGIKNGDIIVSINGEEIKSCQKVSDIISASGGQPLSIVIRRDGNEQTVTFTAALSAAENRYLAGMWIRDSAAGIGTMTYYDKTTGIFAGLGHGVCDADTGDILPLGEGDIVKASVCGCYKGKAGEAGELCGIFTGNTTGLLCMNTATGVFGIIDSVDQNASVTPLALKEEVKTGEAKIISTVDENGPCEYSIEIVRIDTDDSQHRNMIIKVTDEKLLEKTGGIVQGMSGSPIIQNGMLVGAVTHVFVNDPTRGYAIFADEMYETMNNAQLEKAS